MTSKADRSELAETRDGSQARAKYEAFIAAIDNSIAARDENYQTLADRVAASAEQNANDTMRERGFDAWPVNEPEYWVIALDSARFMLDDWRGNYPELRREG